VGSSPSAPIFLYKTPTQSSFINPKKARIERGYTQKELGNHLGRSAASISELERANVQVNAADLYSISKFLNKPIEYFYGEEDGENEIKDLIAILRRQSPEAMNQSIMVISLIIQMQEVSDKLNENPDEDPSIDDIRKFLDAFIQYQEYLNKLSINLDEIKSKLINELKEQGIDL